MSSTITDLDLITLFNKAIIMPSKSLSYCLNVQEETYAIKYLQKHNRTFCNVKSNYDGSIIIYYYTTNIGNYIISYNFNNHTVEGYYKTHFQISDESDDDSDDDNDDYPILPQSTCYSPLNIDKDE